jgi:hypothetical protein
MIARPGNIGVNTASDTGELLLVLGITENVILARPLAGGMEHIFPAANFWPLITKQNGGE